MRYPYDNFPQGWSLTAGYEFGDQTSYGFHEAQDTNNLDGGNSDYGLPIYCIADGEVTSVHNHTTQPTFGNHLHYYIEGPWGVRWIHHAHCSEIFVKVGDKIKEGQLIAKIGNSGTEYAHDHWAIKRVPTGIDSIAKTKEDLKMWENPISFMKEWLGSVIITPNKPMNDQTVIDLGTHGKHEIQAIRGFYADAKNWKKDKESAEKEVESLKTQLANVTVTNKQQSDMLSLNEKQFKQLTKDIEAKDKEITRLLKQSPVVVPKSSLGSFLYQLALQLG